MTQAQAASIDEVMQAIKDAGWLGQVEWYIKSPTHIEAKHGAAHRSWRNVSPLAPMIRLLAATRQRSPWCYGDPLWANKTGHGLQMDLFDESFQIQFTNAETMAKFIKEYNLRVDLSVMRDNVVRLTRQLEIASELLQEVQFHLVANKANNHG